jgi:hypothetical protein
VKAQTAPVGYRVSQMERLTGIDLLNHVDSLYGHSTIEIVTKAGYIRSNEKPDYTSFYEATMRAKIQRDSNVIPARVGIDKIIDAIKTCKNYSKYNDEVRYRQLYIGGPYCVDVLYYGNVIARVCYSTKRVHFWCSGYKTKSTKDRLNRIMMHLCGCRLFQKNYNWLVIDAVNEVPFVEGMDLPMI